MASDPRPTEPGSKTIQKKPYHSPKLVRFGSITEVRPGEMDGLHAEEARCQQSCLLIESGSAVTWLTEPRHVLIPD